MFVVDRFTQGLNKFFPPHLLKPEMSAELKNADIARGVLESVNYASIANDTVKNVHIGNYVADSGINLWFSHNEPMIYIDYAKMVVKSAANELSLPQKYDISGNLIGDLGVKNPTAAPTVSENNSVSGPLLDNELYSYVYTFVKGYAESAPSPAGTITTTSSGVSIDVTTPLAADEGVDAIRIYRGGGGTAEFLLVDEFAGGVYTDSKTALELGPPVETWYNDAPKTGLILDCLFNGRLVGHVRGESILRFSNPVNFESWSEYDTINFDSNIVKAVNFHGSIIVLCRSGVYQLLGTSPEDVQKIQVPTEQGCISEFSPIVVNNILYFQSPDGICAFDGSSVRVVTRHIFPTEYFSGKRLISGAKDGVIYFVDSTGAGPVYDTNIGLWREVELFDKEFFSTLPLVYSFFYEKESDTLYVATDQGIYDNKASTYPDSNISTKAKFLYKSGVYGQDNIIKFYRTLRVFGDGKFTIRIYLDGELAKETDVALKLGKPELIFYPRKARGYTTQIEIEGVGEIHSYFIEGYQEGTARNG